MPFDEDIRIWITKSNKRNMISFGAHIFCGGDILNHIFTLCELWMQRVDTATDSCAKGGTSERNCSQRVWKQVVICSRVMWMSSKSDCSNSLCTVHSVSVSLPLFRSLPCNSLSLLPSFPLIGTWRSWLRTWDALPSTLITIPARTTHRCTRRRSISMTQQTVQDFSITV